MDSSRVDLNDLKEICEKLYTESYYKLSTQKNNSYEAADEFRNLIRQTDIHCSIQNVNKACTDVLKNQFISEYTTIIDNREEDGLLPIISNDWRDGDWVYYLPKSMNSHSDQQQVLKTCVKFVDDSLNAYTFKTSRNDSPGICSNPNSFSKPRFQPQSNRSTLNERESLLTKNLDKNKITRPSTTNHVFSSALTEMKNQFQSKNSLQTSENSFKKRSIENSESTTRFLKKHFSRSNYNQSNTEQDNNESLKKSFLPARSMYKNPLKKVEDERKQQESSNPPWEEGSDIKTHPSLKNFDPKIVGIILSEIMDFSPDVKWSDIAGLEFVKSTVQEIVIWPLLRPDIFTGLRAPPRGILLFGPPGTGKTLIGKCIATESNSTFFCISASSLASKWVGESEQLVRALFAIAQLHQPAVIFIDEIDSLLSQRSDQEQDHTRKLKTEFLVQFDGAKTNSERRVLVVGATNRPHELDEAARRRFVKRLYVPLPEECARLQIIDKLLGAHQHKLSKADLQVICEETKGYSGSDVAHLCKEAAMGPIRSIGPEQIKTVSLDQVRPIELVDFLDALKQVRASVAQEDLNYYLDWNKKFGSFAI